jgi:2-oxoglutarate ferredoxin oxidoreductase subunit gamma
MSKIKKVNKMYHDMIITGFGGQGIQMISQLVAVAAIKKDLNVSFLPSYGVEKRGGRTNVTLVISNEEIGSPITNNPEILLAMDLVGLEFYQDQLQKGGLLIVNSSLIPDEKINNGDIEIIKVKCNEEAVKIGNPRLANMVTLGSLIQRMPIFSKGDIKDVIAEVLPEHHRDKIPDNIRAIERGIEIGEEQA